jgi:MFS family permease
VLITEEAEERLGDEEAAFLATRRGALTLVLLCSVQFLDLLDASIVNVALPSIRRDLDFSEHTLQWVLSGYLLTYGGFLLLGGRAADLLGRRRIVVAARPCSASPPSSAGWPPVPAHWSPRASSRASERR